MAGYSGTPLPKKLGIAEGSVIGFVRAPEGIDAWIGDLPEGVRVKQRVVGGFDVLVFFTTERRDLERRIERLASAVYPAGRLWISWPKRASKVPTTVTEDVVREVALPLGLVDNKVAAISDVWSGLQLVWRLDRR